MVFTDECRVSRTARQTGRGKGCQVGIIDEAKFFKKKTLESSVLPMLVQSAVLIFASTPEIGENPCESIINGIWNGQNATIFMDFKLTCKYCQPIVEANPTYKCPHHDGWRPMHQDPEIVAMTQAVYGNSESYQREIFATQVRTREAFIAQRYIDELRTAPWFVFSKQPEELFIAIDPASSTLNFDSESRSLFAVVAGCFVDGQLVVSHFSFVYFFTLQF